MSNELFRKIDVKSSDLYDMVMEVNNWNGNLEYLRYDYNDDDFFDIYYSGRKDGYSEVARAVCYGDYNYTDEYVQINAYGNLTTVSEWEMYEELQDSKDAIIEEFLNIIDEGNDSYLDYETIINFDEQEEEVQRALAEQYPDLFDFEFEDEEEY